MLLRMKRVIQILFCVFFVSVSSNQWNYGHLGPDIWKDFYPSCAGESQSPINILTACTQYKKFESFKFTSAYDQAYYFKLINNGHTIIGIPDSQLQQKPIELTGGGLNGTFRFINFHLHWGENYRSGSEHQINGMKYAGEIHFVYENPVTSQMAVLGIFMESCLHVTNRIHLDHNDKTRSEWQRYFDQSEKLKVENSTTTFEAKLHLLMGENLNDFWRYEGSLTTPPCTEGIIWTMFKKPIIFKESLFKHLRDNIYFEDYRGPQPLYNRTVYRNFLHEKLSTVPDYNRCVNNQQHTRVHEAPLIFTLLKSLKYSSFSLFFTLCVVSMIAALIFCRIRYSNLNKCKSD